MPTQNANDPTVTRLQSGKSGQVRSGQIVALTLGIIQKLKKLKLFSELFMAFLYLLGHCGASNMGSLIV